MLRALETVGFVLVILLFAIAIYARHRMLQEERRPGYLIKPGEPGSDYEAYIGAQGDERVRPRSSTRDRWARKAEQEREDRAAGWDL